MKFRPDPYVLTLIGAVIVASFAPVRGQSADILDWVTKAAIFALFFLHGARLSWESVRAGATHWRLQGATLIATFVLFPLIGLLTVSLIRLPDPIKIGIVYLCCLPSTIQSSLAMVAVARGNMAAAVCAASLSNILGVIITPLLVGFLLHAQAPITPSAALKVAAQLLLPFVLGQLLRPWLKAWIDRSKKLLFFTDRGSVVLVVYGAFSAAVVEGVWKLVSPLALLGLAVFALALLIVALTATVFGARLLRFSTEDEITLAFCGSKKSLATGAPMAAAIFPAATVGPVLLPLMIYHQLQLILCAVLAGRYARRAGDAAAISS
ncbi:MAG: bile acid:sodium symporter [Caulobacteraceae bacterium]|nr:bile acid:sodium symporter [Caulobacteraceae bacterium]